MRYAETIRCNYAKATIYIHGKKVMEEGKVLDPEWWREKQRRPKKSRKFEGVIYEANVN